MKSKLILCAEGVAIDQQSNNVTVYNILEEITPVALPTVFPRFFVLSVVEKDKNDGDVADAELKISLASKVILRQEIKFMFGGKQRVRSLIELGGMPLSGPGKLHIAISQGTKIVHSYDVIINPASSAPVATVREVPSDTGVPSA
jgi:hypothetical protein